MLGRIVRLATAASSASTEAAPACTTEHVDVDAEIAAALARRGGEDVLELDAGGVAACSPGQVHDFPEFVTVHPTPPNGYCFYASMVKHLLDDDSADLDRGLLSVPMVAGLCLQCLVQRKCLMEDIVADSHDNMEKRRWALRRERAYWRHIPGLSSFDRYVLDKLEVLVQGIAVLDSHHYAGTPEIEALLHTFGLSLLSLRL